MYTSTSVWNCVSLYAQRSSHCVHSGERRKRGKTDRRSTELSTIIRNCLEQTILLELMPSSQIDVYVQVLQVGHSLH